MKAGQAEVSVKSKMLKGWFSELIDGSASGYSFNLKCEEILFEGKSKYQDIIVFRR